MSSARRRWRSSSARTWTSARRATADSFWTASCSEASLTFWKPSVTLCQRVAGWMTHPQGRWPAPGWRQRPRRFAGGTSSSIRLPSGRAPARCAHAWRAGLRLARPHPRSRPLRRPHHQRCWPRPRRRLRSEANHPRCWSGCLRRRCGSRSWRGEWWRGASSCSAGVSVNLACILHPREHRQSGAGPRLAMPSPALRRRHHPPCLPCRPRWRPLESCALWIDARGWAGGG